MGHSKSIQGQFVQLLLLLLSVFSKICLIVYLFNYRQIQYLIVFTIRNYSTRLEETILRSRFSSGDSTLLFWNSRDSLSDS